MSLHLTFSDRLPQVMKLSAAYKTALPQKASSEVQKDARVSESTAFSQASSREDYHHRLQKIYKELQRSAPVPPQIPCTVDNFSSSTPSKGLQFGHYTSATPHASGLFSTIYRARSPQNDIIALKLTSPSQMAQPHNSIREARILASNTHPHIIPLLSTLCQPGGHFILVFPFLPNNLSQLLQACTLTTTQVSSHLYDLFSALSHLHSQGIIHRDIKPSNILLASLSGPAYLADFGIAWSPADEASEPVDAKIADVGTTSYRAPELLFGSTAYDCSLDLWAAGCVVAEAVSRKDSTLFDAGPLGSELALIQSIFKTLGTPTVETWPEAANLPDWGKMKFHCFPPKPWIEVLKNANEDARNLSERLVTYQSSERLSAEEVLQHDFFKECRERRPSL